LEVALGVPAFAALGRWVKSNRSAHWWRRRIHPALLFGAAVLWSGEIIATILNFSPAWRGLMVRLVNAWGYAG
jgi:hypothetical protein